MNNLEKSGKLTADAKNWLIQALDPFHDYSHNVAGYPDTDGSNTVVSCITKTLNISAPSGIGTNNWDCHIVNLPDIIQTNTAGQGRFTARNITNAAAIKNAADTSMTDMPFIVNTCLSGQLTFPETYNVAFTPTNFASTGLSFDEYIDGPCRVIGYGYEVHNTTAEINKQGTLTTYRLPQSAVPFPVISSNDNSNFQAKYGYQCKLPPGDVATALLLAGSRQWEAAEGCYCVIPFNSSNNPLATEGYGDVWYTLNTTENNRNTVGIGPVLVPLTLGLTTNLPSVSTSKIIPFDSVGSYFTGLSPSSTLTLTVRIFLEQAPNYNAQLMVLATPSADYDPLAFELYSQIISKLPISTKVADNASGDWYMDILRIVQPLATPLAKAVDTIAPGVGGSLLAASKILSDSIQKAERISKATPKQKEALKKLGDPNLKGKAQPSPTKSFKKGR